MTAAAPPPQPGPHAAHWDATLAALAGFADTDPPAVPLEYRPQPGDVAALAHALCVARATGGRPPDRLIAHSDGVVAVWFAGPAGDEVNVVARAGAVTSHLGARKPARGVPA